MATTTFYVNSPTTTILGLSTDTKPTQGIIVGSKFWETDTGHIFLFDGVSTWFKPSPL